MPDFSAGAALPFDFNAISGVTPDFTPAGDNLCVIAALGGIEFGLPINFTLCRYGGTGGTDIPELGTGASFVSGNAQGHTYVLAGVSAGTVNIAADWDAAPLQCMAGAVVYSDVDPSDPVVRGTPSSGFSSSSSTTATANFSDCIVGQRIGAWFYLNSDSVVLDDCTESDPDIEIPTQSTFRDYCGLAWVHKLAEAETDSISVTVNGSSSTGLSWLAIPFKLNAAPGGGGFGAGPLVNAFPLKSKLRGLVT